MSHIGIFRVKFEKAIVIFESSTLERNNNDFSTNAVNIGLRFPFSTVLVSSFFDDQGQSPGPCYKVCPTFMYSYSI